MSVTQFAEHVSQHFEELLVVHPVVNLTGIAVVYLIPIETVCLPFIVEKAVSLIHNLP